MINKNLNKTLNPTNWAYFETASWTNSTSLINKPKLKEKQLSITKKPL